MTFIGILRRHSIDLRVDQNELPSDIESMRQFAISYFGEPKFDSPEKGARYMEEWKAWVGGLGEALVNPGTILGKGAKIVSNKGVSDDSASSRLTGFSILKATSIDAALEIAKNCPHLAHGTLHVAEVMDMH
jgi:hypothetical protein